MQISGTDITSILILGVIVFIGLFTIGLVFARLYHRASKERAFVRTGLGGQKVVKDGGAIVLPIFHEVIPVNMNTLKLEVMRNKVDSLIAKDRMRVDIVAAFFVRVIPSLEGIANAAQTLGQRTLHPDALKELVEDKFVDALRSTAATMTMQQLQDQRPEFVQGVQNAVSEDLTKNGLELESVSLTSLDQTAKDFFNANNAFDAEGLTRLTQETENRRRQRNEIEQDTEVAVRQKNLDAEKQKLDIQRQEQLLKLDQEQQVKFRAAEQASLVAARQAEKEREAAQARIDAERQVKEAEIERDRLVKQKSIEAERTVQVQGVEREKAIEIATQEKAIVVAAKSEEQSHAQAKANEALAQAVKAEQAVETTRATASADREKQIALISASREAEQKAIAVKVAAEAEKDAANNRAAAIKIKADADRVAFEVEATGKRLINDAINVLSSEQIGMQVKLALMQSLPAIIEKSVEPMKRIDGIKIVQVDGLTRGYAANGSGPVPSGGNGSLAEQAVAAALAYRAQSPIIDGLLKELGMAGGNLKGLTQAVLPEETVPSPAATDK
ncbi:MAG: flotillin family protein [Xanthobacteraceae bacterium]